VRLAARCLSRRTAPGHCRPSTQRDIHGGFQVTTAIRRLALGNGTSAIAAIGLSALIRPLTRFRPEPFIDSSGDRLLPISANDYPRPVAVLREPPLDGRIAALAAGIA